MEFPELTRIDRIPADSGRNTWRTVKNSPKRVLIGELVSQLSRGSSRLGSVSVGVRIVGYGYIGVVHLDLQNHGRSEEGILGERWGQYIKIREIEHKRSLVRKKIEICKQIKRSRKQEVESKVYIGILNDSGMSWRKTKD